MSRIVHMCINIRGALLNWKDREWRGVVTHEGRTLSPREAKQVFLDELAKGHVVLPVISAQAGMDLPIGPPCPATAAPREAVEEPGPLFSEGWSVAGGRPAAIVATSRQAVASRPIDPEFAAWLPHPALLATLETGRDPAPVFRDG